MKQVVKYGSLRILTEHPTQMQEDAFNFFINFNLTNNRRALL